MCAQSSTELSEREELLARRLRFCRFLVADASSVRKTIRSLLNYLKVPASQYDIVDTLPEAKTFIDTKWPEFVFADQTLLGPKGLDLMELHRMKAPSGQPMAFFMITSRGTEAGVASAAAENVDGVLVKPFTFDSLKDSVLQVLEAKVMPTRFQKSLTQAREKLASGALEEALTEFQNSQQLAGPADIANTFYWEGVTLRKMGKLSESQTAFNEGLTIDPLHYKCLNGMLELLMQRGDLQQAYEISKRLTEHHPVPLKQIPDLIRLSIHQKNFDAVVSLYEAAETSIPTDEQLGLYMASGLIVCGLHFLKNGDKDGAINAFRKAEVAGKSGQKFMKRIIVALLDAGLENEMKSFLSRTDAEVMRSPEVILAQIEFHLKKGNFPAALESSMTAIHSGQKSVRMYEIAIHSSILAGRSPERLRDLVHEASNAFPESAEHFEKIAAAAPKPA